MRRRARNGSQMIRREAHIPCSCPASPERPYGLLAPEPVPARMVACPYWLRAFLVWTALMLVEMLHGIVRAIVLVPVVGDVRSRQIGVLSGSGINLGIACLFIRWMGARSDRTLAGIGICWAGLTVLFEVTFGHVVARLPWTRISADFDLARGGLLPVGLVALAGSPLVAARLRCDHTSLPPKNRPNRTA